MVWCKHCAEDHPTIRDYDNGYVCCSGCGRVIDQDVFVNDVSFVKTAGGQSQLAGSFIRSVQSEYSVSHERTLMKGREEISDMVGSLCVSGGDSIINQAHAFYTIAVERSFTRGRRTALVAASCLYIACRQNEKAYLLIDFSEYLQINVYVLGAVFLQLCKLLRLEEHPIVQKPVDPSLFIHRFTERDYFKLSLNMDLQTGRKPSGLCGAALYISALSHGLKYSKSDIVSVVHICEATLTKRLIEFENTESGSLTIEEFITKSSELEGELQSKQQPSCGSKISGITEVLCEHKDRGEPHFAHGLCRKCYDDFVELSGGLQGGSEPPAFQRAERQRMAEASSKEKSTEQCLDTMPSQSKIHHKQNEKEVESSKLQQDVIKNKLDTSLKSEGAAKIKQAVNGVASDQSQAHQDTGSIGVDESESLSDIDDVEVDGYLHNEEEKRYKKIIWEEMNKEYLEEQAAKEAAAVAAREAYAANFENCSGDMLAAQELAAAAAAAVAKSRKEKKQKRAEEAKNSKPAQTAAEAARNMLTKKRLSSKINFDVLDKLFDDSTNAENAKKQRVESDISNKADGQYKKKAGESEAIENDDYGPKYGYGEDYDAGGGYGNDYSYYGNQDDGYGYDQGYGSDY
ncbi:transcription factor IIIB 60 kDa subunit isoform X2 [Magnolia sinica]|uniref:transcription factor IIIB 60 kDa subunit isoform X2 n=1 Tax=Magnolia sinica TaxID=86752 RepID=UPI00265A2248|nr:transcription factor IIIB 60 kDa subunit isoform X2 [Magnolia sinica]